MKKIHCIIKVEEGRLICSVCRGEVKKHHKKYPDCGEPFVEKEQEG